jgi:hypothetical protein
MAVAGTLHAQDSRPLAPLLAQAGFGEKYQPADFLRPTFQQADFDGDGIQDTAVLVQDVRTGKRGVVILSGRDPAHHYVIDAGTAFRGSDDLKWLRRWSVYRATTAWETRFDPKTGDIIGGREVKLARPALLLEDPQVHAGGLVYWNGRRYVWIHQGE